MSPAGTQPRRPGVLSRRPASFWPDGLVHHGARLLLLIVGAAVLTLMYRPEERPRVRRFAVGDVPDVPVVARVPFSVPKRTEELERERGDVRASVPPTFDVRPEAPDSMAGRIERFFAQVESFGRGGEGPMLHFLADRSIQATPAQLAMLRDPEAVAALRTASVRAAREFLPQGVADEAVLQGLTTPTIVVRAPNGTESSILRSTVMSRRDVLEKGVGLLPPGSSPDLQQLLRIVLILDMDYSLDLNVTATEIDREAAARAVSTVRLSFEVGEPIVLAGAPISDRDSEALTAYGTALDAGNFDDTGLDVAPYFGAWMLNLILLTVFGLLLFFYRVEVYSNLRWILLIGGLVLVYFGLGVVIAQRGFRIELLPISFVALSVAVLWDGRLALMLVSVLAVLTGVQQPFAGPEAVATTLAAGAAAALSVRAVRTRAQTWVFIAIIATAYTAVLLSLALVYGWEPGDLGSGILAASGNAALSAILAMGFVPVFELFTGITTDQTLLEWADPNRPLLRRLSLEAPGSYAHSINVANLAEAAATAIGANGLLCRVGLYYHDVGKMLQSHFFVENQPEGRNPHDRMRPDDSAKVVREHVLEGLRLAREAKVPEVVAAFIPEHHGTQRIGFFWEKAVAEFGAENLNPLDFSYPGPKPQSKETAVALFADSVESATRALQDPTPERVRDLIEHLIDAKIVDGQLDEAPLTLQDIRVIKEQFIKVLSAVYHHRIDYPQTRHLTESPDARAAAADARERTFPRVVPDDEPPLSGINQREDPSALGSQGGSQGGPKGSRRSAR